MEAMSEFEAILAFSVLLIGLAVALYLVVYTLLTGAPPMPSSTRMRLACVDLLPSKVKGEVIELGSGWGGLTFLLYRRYKGQQVIGLERSPLPWLVAWFRALLVGGPQFKKQDFTQHPLDGVGLCVCYLNPEVMVPTAAWLEQGMPKGGWVGSIGFAIPGKEPVKVQRVDDLLKTPIYLYRY
uniref:Putative S-adenosyl-L-methionine-dependent methyltransferases n=1 Tax=Magnetococcus massalia (strain MO-1) TaxID=451514 RepID=A0A1S7LH56_MAGMO|nr:Putative S-adenosyl-L-methionine-dependent methyltransferases [Candidatus Magnetococcus massalia]